MTRKTVTRPKSPHKTLISSRSKPSAWVDPADTQPAKISLLNGPFRLRKLRQVVDEDEITGREYETRLRSQFERINPEPVWARKARGKKNENLDVDDSGDEGTEEETGEGMQRLLTSTKGVLAKSKKAKTVVLHQGSLAIERVRDANHSTQSSSSGEVRVISFHPKPAIPVLCVATADRRVRLFHVG
jgi:U3 small nucleolar RNA-associated protein 18